MFEYLKNKNIYLVLFCSLLIFFIGLLIDKFTYLDEYINDLFLYVFIIMILSLILPLILLILILRITSKENNLSTFEYYLSTLLLSAFWFNLYIIKFFLKSKGEGVFFAFIFVLFCMGLTIFAMGLGLLFSFIFDMILKRILMR